jgi:spore coat polysaccharide biosynthesis protein SpsF
MGSSRLPGKVLLPLSGKPLVWHIADRLRRVAAIDDIVLATTADVANDPLVAWGEDMDLPIVRWPNEDDIIGRLLSAADLTGADVFVKVNADCPLIDPDIIDAVLSAFLAGDDVDLATNKLDGSFPLGYSIEIVRVSTLRRCDHALQQAAQRELVIQWMIDHPQEFRLLGVSGSAQSTQYGLTVDYPADYEIVSKIFEALYRPGECFGLEAVLRFLHDDLNTFKAESCGQPAI